MHDPVLNLLCVHAYNNGYIDLDEYACCVDLGELIRKEAPTTVKDIVLDLRKCFLEYLHVSHFLDPSLEKLRESPAENKRLVIKTTVDLFSSKESCASLFFQMSGTLKCNSEDSQQSIFVKLTDFCRTHGVQVVIDVFHFDKTSDSDSPGRTYELHS